MLPKIHAKYVKAALQGKFFPQALSEKAGEVVQKAVKHSDSLQYLSSMPAQHATPDARQGVKFIGEVLKHSKKQFKKAAILLKNKEKPHLQTPEIQEKFKKKIDTMLVKGLYSLGRAFHAVHDFFAHNNILHLTPRPKDRELTAMLLGKQPLPKNLFGATFKIKREIPRILGCGAININAIPKKWLTPIFNKMEPRYKAPGQAPISHCVMNIDAPRSFHSLYWKMKKGYSGFNATSRMAIRATHNIFEKGIKAPLTASLGEEKAGKLFAELKNWMPGSPDLIRNSNKIGENAILPVIKPFIVKPASFKHRKFWVDGYDFLSMRYKNLTCENY